MPSKKSKNDSEKKSIAEASDGLGTTPATTGSKTSKEDVDDKRSYLRTGTIPKRTDNLSSGEAKKQVEILSNDNVRRNPPRKVRRNHCQSCYEPDTSRMVQCDTCDLWYHFSCVEVSAGIADVSWICPMCDVIKDPITPSEQNTAGDQIVSNLAKDRLPKDRTSLSQSKMGSSKSESKRRRDLALQKLEAEFMLEKRYIERMYDILLVDETDAASVVSETDSDKMLKIQDWIAATERVDQPPTLQVNEFVPGQRSTPKQPVPQRLPQLTENVNDETVCILNRSQIAARQAISKDLPEFSGSPEDWPLFYSMFNTSTQMCGFSNEENMLRLRKCLRGKALEAVRCRLLHPSNVSGVLSTLKMLYGRPEAIVQAIIGKVRGLPSPNIEKLETVVNFALTVENLVATIQACEVSDFVYNVSLRYELVERLPPTLKLDWAKFSRSNPTPNLLDFSSWLYSTAEDASAIMTTPSQDQRPRTSRKDTFLNYHSATDSEGMRPTRPVQKATFVLEKSSSVQCIVCKGSCSSLTVNASRNSAVSLGGQCKGQYNKKSASSNEPSTVVGQNNEPTCNVHQGQSEVLFRVVPVILYGPSKTIRTHAFIDDGSELTLIEQSLADELELKGPAKSLCLKWTGGARRTESSSQRVSLQISGNVDSTKKYNLSSIQTIGALQIRPQTLLVENMQERFQHLRGLPLESYHNVSPRLLIGLDHAGLGYAKESREGKPKEPIAVKTRLGWAVYGSCVGEEKAFRYVNYHSLQVCQCNLEIDGALYKAVKNYFTLDSLGIHTPGKPMLSTEDQRAQTLLETLTRPKNGRFESGLLWKYDNVRLPDSEGMALRRWRCLDSRLRKDPILAETLTTKIDDHITKGYIRKLTVEELRLPHTRVWYLPIFPVDNPNKPGKTRLVWDAAATAHGISLNSVLLKGPDQLTSLLTVLIQFREYKTAVCGDIREMYHQVQIREDDQHCQRFFWKDKPEDLHPSVYIMMVMTFGARCSPSTAQYIKNHNAERFQQDYPAAVHAITKQHYVDDMLVSVESEKEALQIANDVRMIHAKAGFEMRNWISNSANVQAELHGATADEKNLSIGDENATEKVLGMWWDTVTDRFTYKLSARYAQDLLSGHQRPTKREVLRMLMMIFDPLGIIAHFLMFLKVLLQEIWRSGIGWDDPIEDVHFEKWLLWLSVLPQVTSVRIPRCYRVQTSLAADTEVQMHTFVDASENGFAAVIYLRFRQGDIIECAQVGAKTKVAPLKFLSIPRSELQAAVIGMRLAETIAKSLSFEVIKRFFWTDSRDVIYWLNSDHRRYSQFVAFRVSEILDTTNADEWYWIGTKLNVADEGTKWKGTPNLDASSRWFRGPEFLWFPEREWPKSPKLVESSTVEELRPHLLLHVASSYVLRYIGNLKRSVKKKNLICGPLIQQEFVKAEYYLFRLAQSFAYADEIVILMRNRSLEGPKREISRNSALFNKCVVLDENDVLRIRGRAQNSPFIHYDAANPIVLPRDHHITRLIIADVHNRFNHQNHQTIINELRQRYRIPRLKATYNNIRRECQQCKIDGANPQPPAMCDLPPQRLAVFARPFTHMGIDYFGPMLVSVGRRTEKRWGVLATCLTTRAIYVQLAHTLSTDSCIMAIRNIMSRRGIPAVIYSDRGTNFQGTSKELQTAILNLNHDQLGKEFTSSHTQWYFIPPASPHMGGAWERLIRSVKQNLHKIKTSRLPTDEVFGKHAVGGRKYHQFASSDRHSC
ncbi:uncharacterized protein LOC131679651 [Topomyia yanbarensis]|uniref:uncharacterized protein LOC131679651 n=1 Tax=Topomyia yanbarensis TaxID=2498891 RepID=UPI00273BE582|nr:uncharacterized protein LOC131679651 [Topomyia yanbarensis]